MPKFRRRRAAQRRNFLIPGALYEALRLESAAIGISRAKILFSTLADRLRQSNTPGVTELITEYDNEEGTIAAENEERELAQSRPRF